MKINKQQKICDVNDCYKAISFITEEFLSNKVLWTCEKHIDLLNKTKNWKQIKFYHNVLCKFKQQILSLVSMIMTSFKINATIFLKKIKYL